MPNLVRLCYIRASIVTKGNVHLYKHMYMLTKLKWLGILATLFVVVACDKPVEDDPEFEVYKDSYVLGLYNGEEMFVSSLGFTNDLSERLYEQKLRKVQVHVGSSTSEEPGVVYLLGKDSSNVYYLTTYNYESQQFTWKEIINTSMELHELVNVGGVPYSFDIPTSSLVQLDFNSENVVRKQPVAGVSINKKTKLCSDGTYIYAVSGKVITVIDPATGVSSTRDVPTSSKLGAFGGFHSLNHAFENMFVGTRINTDAIEVSYIVVPDSGTVEHYPKAVIENLRAEKSVIDVIYSTLFDDCVVGIYEDKPRDPYSIFRVNMTYNVVTQNIVIEPFDALQIGETIKVYEK